MDRTKLISRAFTPFESLDLFWSDELYQDAQNVIYCVSSSKLDDRLKLILFFDSSTES